MRVFAGPNGSGKSVLKSYLPEPLLGVYLNPDEIEAEVKDNLTFLAPAALSSWLALSNKLNLVDDSLVMDLARCLFPREGSAHSFHGAGIRRCFAHVGSGRLRPADGNWILRASNYEAG